MGNETVIIPRLSLDETPTFPPFPLVKVSEFVDSSLGFALSRATLGVGALLFGPVFLLPVPCLTWPSLPLGWSSLAPWPRFYWSLPLGIVASGDGLVALPLCVECLLRIVSPPHYVSWQQRPLALCGDLSLYTMLHVLLGAVCSLTEVLSLYDPWPLFGLR